MTGAASDVDAAPVLSCTTARRCNRYRTGRLHRSGIPVGGSRCCSWTSGAPCQADSMSPFRSMTHRGPRRSARRSVWRPGRTGPHRTGARPGCVRSRSVPDRRDAEQLSTNGGGLHGERHRVVAVPLSSASAHGLRFHGALRLLSRDQPAPKRQTNRVTRLRSAAG
jgi:hypothetical protein